MMNFDTDQSTENIKPDIVISESFFKFNLGKIIFIMAILVILGEGIWLFIQYNGSKDSGNSRGQLVQQIKKEPVKLTLTTPNNTQKLGDQVEVTVVLSSGLSEVEGVDVVLEYDNSILEASKSGIIKGDQFFEYPQTEVISSDGKIRVSAISEISKNFTGTGNLFKVLFKTKKLGETDIKFEFTKGSTTDSNVVNTKSSDDLLEEVQNIKIMVE